MTCTGSGGTATQSVTVTLNGKDGFQGLRAHRRQLPNGASGLLGLEVPQGHVDGIAGAARREQRMQGGSVDAAADFRGNVLDLCEEPVGGLIAVVDAQRLAAPDVAAGGQLHHHGIEGVPGFPGDAKRPDGRPMLEMETKLHERIVSEADT